MKSLRNVWSEVTSFCNLLLAARKAQRGKRFVPSTAVFNYNLEAELLRIQRQLVDRSYRPGRYRTFHIYRPKKRLISAAPGMSRRAEY